MKEEKICSKCKIPKPLDDFSNRKKSKDGKRPRCKVCDSVAAAKYHKENKEKVAERNKERYWENPEKAREKGKQAYNKNKEKYKQTKKKWREDNPEKVKQMWAEWYKENREHKLKIVGEWEKNQMKNNPSFRLKKNLRYRIIDVIKGDIKKSAPTMELLGCTIEEFRDHLEKQFRNDITWDNHGEYWHVDHIKPCSLFDLSKEEEQRKCFHYKNMQPLEAEINIKKSDKYPYTIKN